MRALGIAAVLALLATPAALAQSALPDPAKTPGALNPEVTQATIGTTICVRGWTQTVRPPQAYTLALKRQQIRVRLCRSSPRRVRGGPPRAAGTRWRAI